MKAWMSLNFGKFATELRPLIDVRIWFLLNILKTIVRQRNSIFYKKRAIPSIENVFVYSDRYGNSDLKYD